MRKMFKRFFKFIRGRFFVTSIMILTQIVLLALIMAYLGSQSAYFFIGLEVLSVIVALIILNRDINPAYKLSFILLVLLVPLAGVTFYFMFGREQYAHRHSKQIKNKHDFSEKQFENINSMELLDPNMDPDIRKLFTYVTNTSKFSLSNETETKLLTPGEVKLKYLLEELSKAKSFIFLEYFIVEPGIMWTSIMQILAQKAKEGVDVRLLYDDFGSVGKIPNNFAKVVSSYGIKVKAFNPYRPRLAGKMNYRDHRKIVVIDGNVGFLGGINIADEYINAVERFGHWKDTSVMLKGQGVWNLTVLFFQLWHGVSTDEPNIKDFYPTYQSKVLNPGIVQTFGDSAFNDHQITANVYMQIINSAKHYVYMTSPYLILDNEMITAIKSAALSGIDVRIMVPHVPDKKLIFWVTQSHFKSLISAGVKIYEYLPGFLHAKTIVSDDIVSMAGTANLDYRSLYLHFEVSTLMYKTKATTELKTDFDNCLKVAKEITLENCPKIGPFKGLLLFLIKAFYPLM